MKTGSIYSASDKALFDALNQPAVTNSDMRQLFLMHGIIISKKTSRKELALLYSRLLHDYDDFHALSKLFDSGYKRERLSSFKVNSSATIEDFEGALHHAVAKLREESDAASVSQSDDGSLKIMLRYKSFNFSKSEFKQIETRDAVITVEKIGDAVVIRGPQNDKVDEVCRDIISHVEAQVDGKLNIDEVDLESYPSPNDRTQFFLDLIEKVQGYKKYDVTDVYVYKPKIKSDEETDEEDEDTSGEEKDDIDLGVHISRASLKGEGVLSSDEMKSLIDRGFYISKIVWKSKEAGAIDPDIYEFEAQFSEPESCTRFSYLCRGYYKYAGSGRYAITRSHLLPDEDRQISQLIDDAARTSLAILRRRVEKGVEDA